LITRLFSSALAILALSSVAGCSNFYFPGVYRINIQQGNVISQTMIDKLKPGMSKSQVRFVLGNPVIDDHLNDDRWDYIYTIQIGDTDRVTRELHVHFIEERLSYFSGDFKPTEVAPKDNVTS
jgi:outer membrane protein assembly factor BamE